jgi:hypothetical protein
MIHVTVGVELAPHEEGVAQEGLVEHCIQQERSMTEKMIQDSLFNTLNMFSFHLCIHCSETVKTSTPQLILRGFSSAHLIFQ